MRTNGDHAWLMQHSTQRHVTAQAGGADERRAGGGQAAVGTLSAAAWARVAAAHAGPKIYRAHFDEPDKGDAAFEANLDLLAEDVLRLCEQ